MHKSVAEAMYRGQMRQANGTFLEYLRREAVRPVVGRRKAWVNRMVRVINAAPSTIVLDVATRGRSVKQSQTYVCALTLFEGRWAIMAFHIMPKTFMVEAHDLPIDITHHLIQRIMQREDIHNVMDAMHFLAPAAGIAVALMAHPDDEVLVPCGTGAVFSRRSDVKPTYRALTTYVPDDSLRPEQKKLMDATRAFAMKEIERYEKEFGGRRP